MVLGQSTDRNLSILVSTILIPFPAPISSTALLAWILTTWPLSLWMLTKILLKVIIAIFYSFLFACFPHLHDLQITAHLSVTECKQVIALKRWGNSQYDSWICSIYVNCMQLSVPTSKPGNVQLSEPVWQHFKLLETKSRARVEFLTCVNKAQDNNGVTLIKAVTWPA